jgi:hypothetical protein
MYKYTELDEGDNPTRSRDTTLLSTIKERLRGVEKYVEARRVIEDYGLTNADEMLAHLGFIVTWKGLDVNEATIALQ